MANLAILALTATQQAILTEIHLREIQNKIAEGFALSPIAICIAFLVIRAIYIFSTPKELREMRRKKLGAWPRFLIVLSILWSITIAVFLAVLINYVNPEIIFGWPLINLTYGPLVAIWLLYLAARWVRQGS